MCPRVVADQRTTMHLMGTPAAGRYGTTANGYSHCSSAVRHRQSPAGGGNGALRLSPASRAAPLALGHRRQEECTATDHRAVRYGIAAVSSSCSMAPVWGFCGSCDYTSTNWGRLEPPHAWAQILLSISYYVDKRAGSRQLSKSSSYSNIYHKQ